MGFPHEPPPKGRPRVWRCGCGWQSQPPPTRPLLARYGGAEGLAEGAHRLQDGGRLVAAVRHAVVAAGIPAAAVLRPVGRLDELLVSLRVPVGHEVAGPLPAEDRVRRNAPGSAREVDLALEKVQEERRVV